MKKFFNNTIVQLLIAVIVGILVGFYVEGTVKFLEPEKYNWK